MKLVVEIYSEKEPRELARLLSNEHSPINKLGNSTTGIIYASRSDKQVKLHLSGIRTDNNKRMADITEQELGFYPESVLYYKVEMDKHTRRESEALGALVKYLLDEKEPTFVLRYIPLMEDRVEGVSAGKASVIGINSKNGRNLIAEDFHMGRD